MSASSPSSAFPPPASRELEPDVETGGVSLLLCDFGRLSYTDTTAASSSPPSQTQGQARGTSPQTPTHNTPTAHEGRERLRSRTPPRSEIIESTLYSRLNSATPTSSLSAGQRESDIPSSSSTTITEPHGPRNTRDDCNDGNSDHAANPQPQQPQPSSSRLSSPPPSSTPDDWSWTPPTFRTPQHSSHSLPLTPPATTPTRASRIPSATRRQFLDSPITPARTPRRLKNFNFIDTDSDSDESDGGTPLALEVQRDMASNPLGLCPPWPLAHLMNPEPQQQQEVEEDHDMYSNSEEEDEEGVENFQWLNETTMDDTPESSFAGAEVDEEDEEEEEDKEYEDEEEDDQDGFDEAMMEAVDVTDVGDGEWMEEDENEPEDEQEQQDEDDGTPGPGSPSEPPAAGAVATNAPAMGGTIHIVDPNTGEVVHTAIIPPLEQQQQQQLDGTPPLANPLSVVFSTLLENVGLVAPLNVAEMTVNDVLFGSNFPFEFQDTERYNKDFAHFFRSLYRDNQIYSQCSGSRHRPPSVSYEAMTISRWARQRPEEIALADTDEDIDIQGVNWKSLGITQQDARKHRRRTYINYRNVEDSVRQTSNPIISNHHYLRFLRISTRQTPRLLHFQLRNILAVTSRNDIFYSTGSTIISHHPYTHSTRTALSLHSLPDHLDPLRISTLTSHHTPTHSLLLAGSLTGTYCLLNLRSPQATPPTTGRLTTHENGITNHIHTTTSRTSSTPLAIFSSNDSHIRTLDTATNRILSSHAYDFPINCAATSPCSRLRAIIGDSTSLLITSAETGRPELQLPKSHTDYGFAVAWSPSDPNLLATGNQDQLVRIFDLRHPGQPLRTISTIMAGCRTLRFTPADAVGRGGVRNLLAVAEPADYVHFVDCGGGEWEKSAETVEFWGEVAGVEWTPDGEQVVVGNGDRCVGGVMVWERTVEGWGERVERRKRRGRGEGTRGEEEWDGGAEGMAMV